MIEIIHLNHVALVVGDLERSPSVYRDVLGDGATQISASTSTGT